MHYVNLKKNLKKSTLKNTLYKNPKLYCYVLSKRKRRREKKAGRERSQWKVSKILQKFVIYVTTGPEKISYSGESSPKREPQHWTKPLSNSETERPSNSFKYNNTEQKKKKENSQEVSSK